MEKEKRQKFAEYIQSIAAIEDSMRPYREQRNKLTLMTLQRFMNQLKLVLRKRRHLNEAFK